MNAPTEFSVVIVVPVFRDWSCVSLLCRELDKQCDRLERAKVSLLLVDDGSPNGRREWEGFAPRRLTSIQALWLRRNLGHQRAIATGLCWVRENKPCDAVIVMDADGEDRPVDAVRLIERVRADPTRIVFAERRKRLESPVFRAGYWLYRWLHLALTGHRVRVGNFSAVPFPCLGRLACASELWNHYAGAVFRSGLPFDCIPMDRGVRYSGRSHMNLIGLVNHGLAGIATFHEVVATRILITNLLAIVLVLAALAVVVGIRLGTNRAIPGWATFTAGLLLVLLAQVLAVSFTMVFTLIANRGNATVVPEREYATFVDRVELLWSDSR